MFAHFVSFLPRNARQAILKSSLMMRLMGSEGQYGLRKIIAKMLKDCKKGKEIANILGMSEGHVSNVRKLVREGGTKSLKPKKRGRPKGKNSVLTLEQEKWIQNTLVDKTPEQMRFKECLWTQNNIALLIKDKFNIEIKPSTLSCYLSRWGFTVQRPVKRAYKQDKAKNRCMA